MNSKRLKLGMACISGLLVSGVTFAKQQLVSSSAPQNKPALSNINAVLRYAYTDFNFNSTVGANYNRFQGHTNSGMVSGDNIHIGPGLTLGLNLFNAYTNLHSQFLVNPSLPTRASATINNKTLLAHVTKSFTKNVVADLAAAFGQNRINSNGVLNPTTSTAISYFSNNKSTNELVSLTGIYSKAWNKYELGIHGFVLYSQLNNNAFNINYSNTFNTAFVPSLKNKLVMLFEGAELGYKLTNQIKPFINGGLFQVPYFKNSPNTTITIVNGFLPQLSANKGGYYLGGGVGYMKKKYSVRLDELYYNSASTFTSWTTAVTLKVLIS